MGISVFLLFDPSYRKVDSGQACSQERRTLKVSGGICLILICLNVAIADRSQAEVYRTHALSLFEDIKYGSDFQHFDYVRPDAPKGGTLRLAWTGTFDTLNPFTLKGVAGAGTLTIYNRLMSKSLDEPFTEYGQLAQSIEISSDRSWVKFVLHPDAQWHDGRPVTSADVVFTFRILVSKGVPFYRTFYADVDGVEALDSHTVKFNFATRVNPELPLIVGQMRVLPRHYWQSRNFEATTLEPPLGSGPYRIESVDPGRSIVYRRVEDYWGRNLPVHRGRHNFDVVNYEYFRDATVAVEALKAGEFDFRIVGEAREWSTAYGDLRALEEGRLIREEMPHQVIRGMEGFCFNTRRTKFVDPRVRQALAYAFDFEWTNANLLYGLYERSRSFWNNSELASSGLPGIREREILDEFQARVPAVALQTPYQPPTTDGSGNARFNLRVARQLLAEAGWRVKDNRLFFDETGEFMSIEFLLVVPDYERIIGPLQTNLRRLGIESQIRTVDASQYQNRLQHFDYDIIVAYWRQTLSPGNEQRNFWTSQAAGAPGSRNYAGIADSVIDELVERIISAGSRAEQVALTRVLDRLLLWGHYVIPGWHSRNYRMVYWNKFGKPLAPPLNGLGFPDTWWAVDNGPALRGME